MNMYCLINRIVKERGWQALVIMPPKPKTKDHIDNAFLGQDADDPESHAADEGPKRKNEQNNR